MIAIAELFSNTENQNQFVFITTDKIRLEGNKYLAEVSVDECVRLVGIGYEVYTDGPQDIQLLKKNQYDLKIPVLSEGEFWSGE